MPDIEGYHWRGIVLDPQDIPRFTVHSYHQSIAIGHKVGHLCKDQTTKHIEPHPILQPHPLLSWQLHHSTKENNTFEIFSDFLRTTHWFPMSLFRLLNIKTLRAAWDINIR
jgi:hypothetical protein